MMYHSCTYPTSVTFENSNPLSYLRLHEFELPHGRPHPRKILCLTFNQSRVCEHRSLSLRPRVQAWLHCRHRRPRIGKEAHGSSLEKYIRETTLKYVGLGNTPVRFARMLKAYSPRFISTPPPTAIVQHLLQGPLHTFVTTRSDGTDQFIPGRSLCQPRRP